MGVMNVIPGWKYLSAGVGALLLVGAGWLIVSHFVIGPRDFHPLEREATLAAIDDLLAQLGSRLDASGRGHLTLALPPIRNDSSGGEIHFALTRQMPDKERFHLATEGLLKGVADEAKGWLLGTEPPPSPERLLHERGELDAVLLVTLESRVSTTEASRVELSALLVERASASSNAPTVTPLRALGVAGQPVAAGDAAMGFFARLWWSLWRIVAAAAGAFAIPFLFLPLTDVVTKRANNAVGIVYLALIVAIAMTPWFALFVLDELGGSGSVYVLGAAFATGCFVWTFKMHDAWSERI